MPELTLDSNLVYKGKILDLRVEKVSLSNGRETVREIVDHPPSVCAIISTASNKVIMVKQFRKAAEKELWELPAGKLEPGEDIETTLRREMEEEVGLIGGHIEKLCEFYVSPGFCTEKMHLFHIKGGKIDKAKPQFDEIIQVKEFEPEEILKMIREGEIEDGKTIAGILLWGDMYGTLED